MALEVTVQDPGRVGVDGLVRRREDVVESLSVSVRDTLSASVSPPAVIGVTTSSWKQLPVKLDGRVLAPVGGDFDRPPPEDGVLSTWRFGHLPVRAGVWFGAPAAGGRPQ